MKNLHSLILIVGMASACLASVRVPNAPQRDVSNQQSAIVEAKDLVEREWRLWDQFQVLPENGYPVSFSANGKVLSRNVAGLNYWKLEQGRLQFFDSYHQPTCAMKLDPRVGVFYAVDEEGRPTKSWLRIGPAGLTWKEALRAGATENDNP